MDRMPSWRRRLEPVRERARNRPLQTLKMHDVRCSLIAELTCLYERTKQGPLLHRLNLLCTSFQATAWNSCISAEIKITCSYLSQQEKANVGKLAEPC